MADIKVGADSNLKVVKRGTWDAAAAKERIFKWAGWPDNPDPAKAKKAFFLYDASNEKNMGAYSDPFADVVNGELVAIDAGITAAASRLPQTDAPESEINRAVAIKDKYMKKIHQDDKEKSELYDSDINVDLMITKASIDPDGIMRWSATVTKFSADDERDEVTPEFYQNAIEHIEKGDYPLPALVVSHYDDPRIDAIGQPVPDEFKAGESVAVFIDRNQPKAKGTFCDTPLGRAVYEAIKSDISSKVPQEERARISMAFRPDPNGIEKSESGVTRYLSGHIRHFAVTRVPIVKETNITVEKSDMRKTRYEDASTIVGEELAAELDKNYNNLRISSKSEDSTPDLVEKAETKNKFDMGGCISEAMGAGKPRKQAIAYCLNVQNEKKKAGVSDNVSLMDLFDHDSCVQEYISQGWSAAAAKAFCDNQAIKMSNMPAAQHSMEGMMNMGDMNKADVVEDTEKVVSEVENADTTKSTETAEKADLDTLMDAVISDDNIQVVKSGSEEEADTSDESKSKMSKKPVNRKDTPANSSEEESESPSERMSETSGMGEENEDKGKSQKKKSEVVDADVNEVKQITPVSADRVSQLAAMYKAALESPDMDRTTKVAAVNSILKELGEIAQERVKSVPMSKDDQATLLKAAIDEAVTPLLEIIQKQREDLKRYESAMKGGVWDNFMGPIPSRPQPKGLMPQAQKSDTRDNGGAMSAGQIAEHTVKYSQVG